MGISAELQHLRNNLSRLIREFDHIHPGMSQRKMRAEHRIRDIQYAAEEGQSESLMRKESDILFVSACRNIDIPFKIMHIS